MSGIPVAWAVEAHAVSTTEFEDAAIGSHQTTMPDLQQTDVTAATPINRILAQAAAAAFANRREEAHELLQQAIRQAPSSPEVWLACAALAGDPVERLAYLERACALNPSDARARALAARARVQVINQLTEQGIAAVREKSMGTARQHFAEIVRLEPTHEVTWLRLAALAESPEEQVALIKQVLRINPANEKARSTLIDAEKQLARTHLKQANAEIEAGQYGNARAALRRSLQLDDTSEDAWSLMALIAEDADERQNAADRLDALRAAQLVAEQPAIAGPAPAAPATEAAVAIDAPADDSAAIEFQSDAVADDPPAVEAAAPAAVAPPVEAPAAIAPEPPALPPAPAAAADPVAPPAAPVEASLPHGVLPVPANVPTVTSQGRLLAGPTIEAVGGEGPFYDRRSSDRGRRATDHVEPAPIELASAPAVVSNLDAAVASEYWTCPFCETLRERAVDVCPTCGGITTLADQSLLFATRRTDTATLEMAVARLEESLAPQGEHADPYWLGMALLNLRKYTEGLAALERSVTKRPGDKVLAAQVATLAATLRPATPEKPPRATVLVVDDSPTIRRVVTTKLEKLNCKVLIAEDGMDALTVLRTATPDLILLDITMPRLDGYQVCKIVKGAAETRHVPVVFISGKDGFFDKARGRMAGSDAYVTKPFGPDALSRVLQTFVPA
jgi:twitching motility two-component system response regulator PilG